MGIESPAAAKRQTGLFGALWETLRKYWLFAAMYFAQGAPPAMLGALVINLFLAREMGFSPSELPEKIGTFTFLAGLPWLAKPLFAALADLAQQKKRHLLLAVSIAMGAGIALVAIGIANRSYHWILVVVVVVNILRAVQDVTTDGLAIESLHGKERPTGQAVMWIANSLGGLAGSAGLLVLKGAGVRLEVLVGLTAVVVAAAGLLGTALSWQKMATLAGQATTKEAVAEKTAKKGAKATIREFLSATFLFGMLLALVAQFGASPFTFPIMGKWMKFLDWDENPMAFAETVWRVAAVIGILAGAFVARRFGNKRTLVLSAVLVAATYAALGLLENLWGQYWTVLTITGMASIGEGMCTVCLGTLFMSLVGRRTTATQYACYMGALNLSGAAARYVGGLFAAGEFTYIGVPSNATVFIVAGGLALLPLLILRWVRPQEE